MLRDDAFKFDGSNMAETAANIISSGVSYFLKI